MNEKIFTQDDLEKVYGIIFGESSPIMLDIVFLGIEDYMVGELEKDPFIAQQIWEWFRSNYGNDVVNAVNYVVCPWDMRGFLGEEEENTILTLATMSLMHKYYNNVKDDWHYMHTEQKDNLLENFIGKHM